jgi:hypothetical protein
VRAIIATRVRFPVNLFMLIHPFVVRSSLPIVLLLLPPDNLDL